MSKKTNWIVELPKTQNIAKAIVTLNQSKIVAVHYNAQERKLLITVEKEYLESKEM